ncbi:MAG: hypothetical protein Q4D76_09575 [Oscillospiraceae bacterium]|nr:hypothetical protein [Oscillospiraceae bacterium]
MVSVMNEYINKINLQTDDITKAIINAALYEQESIEKYNITVKSNRFIVDIHISSFEINKAVSVMNLFIQNCSFHYSSYYIRYNEGNLVRYRFATCKENKEGFYCDIIIS